MNVSASVIIPTYKREESLKNTLDSLLKQNFKEFEILVVDNAVSDSLKVIVETIVQGSSIPIKYVPEPKLGVHNARNRGASVALSEILIFTDDDILFDNNWVERIINAFSSDRIGVVGGKVFPLIEKEPLNSIKDWYLNEGKGFLSILDLGDEKLILPKGNYCIYSCNMAIRKSILKEVGGFNPELYGDVYLGDGETGTLKKVQNAGWDLLYSPDVFLFHVIPPNRLTIDYLKLRAWNQGASDSYTKYHPEIQNRMVLLIDIAENSLRFLYKYFQSSFNFLYHKDKLKLIIGKSYHKSKINYLIRLFIDKDFRKLVERTNWYYDTK